MPQKKNEEAISAEGLMPTSTSFMIGRQFTAYPWLQEIFADERKSPIRVLMLADSYLDFGIGAFGLSEMLTKALFTEGRPWEELTIVTAHRDVGKVAQIPGFRFDIIPEKPPYAVPFTIDHYDQLWLFGYHRQDKEDAPEEQRNELSPKELRILAEFMEAGGGVFATGDHEDLGFALSGRVPRVRSMRKWVWKNPQQDEPTCPPDVCKDVLITPPEFGSLRLDTIREGPDAGFQFTDQSDNVPQEIRPKFFTKPGDPTSYPHALLRLRGNEAIKVMPDHPHEGECVVPTCLTNTFAFDGAPEADEYPLLPDSSERLSPEVVALSTSGAGFITDRDLKPPVEPRCFYNIVAYDGHRVGVGRVVTDATWHHFININLNGKGSDLPSQKGLRDASGNPTPDYEAIKQYYRNIVSWLCPENLQQRRHLNLILAVRYMYPLIEEIRSIESNNLKEILILGARTRNAISRIFSQGEAVECELQLAKLLTAESHRFVAQFIDPYQPPAKSIDNVGLLFNSTVFGNTILGGAMMAVAGGLPSDPHRLNAEKFIRGDSQKSHLDSLMQEGVQLGFNTLIRTLNSMSVIYGNMAAMLDRQTSFSQENQMTFECASGTNKPWLSGLFPAGTPVPPTPIPTDYNDGKIDIPTVNTDGTFKGKHKKTIESEVVGECQHTPKHRISFFRRVIEDGVEYTIHYTGEIVQDSKMVIKNGKYNKFETDRTDAISQENKARILGGENGTWIGERPIT